MDIQEFKNEVNGNFFSVSFIKKDGTLREMTARFGVKKHLKGGTLKYDPEGYGYLTVFDVKKKEYRTINVEKIICLKYNNKEVLGKAAFFEALK